VVDYGILDFNLTHVHDCMITILPPTVSKKLQLRLSPNF